MRCATAGAPAGDDGCSQIGDHILALVRGLQSRERHLVLRDQLLRIEQIGVECGCVPDEIGGLHRGRIIVVRRLTRLLADDARRGSGRASSCRAPANGRPGIFCRLGGLLPHRRRPLPYSRPLEGLGCGLCRRPGRRHVVIVGRSDCCVGSRGRAARRLSCRRSELRCGLSWRGGARRSWRTRPSATGAFEVCTAAGAGV